LCKTWDFHRNDNSCYGLLGYVTVWWKDNDTLV